MADDIAACRAAAVVNEQAMLSRQRDRSPADSALRVADEPAAAYSVE